MPLGRWRACSWRRWALGLRLPRGHGRRGDRRAHHVHGADAGAGAVHARGPAGARCAEAGGPGPPCPGQMPRATLPRAGGPPAGPPPSLHTAGRGVPFHQRDGVAIGIDMDATGRAGRLLLESRSLMAMLPEGSQCRLPGLARPPDPAAPRSGRWPVRSFGAEISPASRQRTRDFRVPYDTAGQPSAARSSHGGRESHGGGSPALRRFNGSKLIGILTGVTRRSRLHAFAVCEVSRRRACCVPGWVKGSGRR